jgi:hypothetical protein
MEKTKVKKSTKIYMKHSSFSSIFIVYFGIKTDIELITRIIFYHLSTLITRKKNELDSFWF